MRAASEKSTETAELFCCVSRLAILQTRKQGEQVPLYYKACGEIVEGKTWGCNRRVDESGFCASCGRNSGKINLRLNVRCRFSDFRDSVWLTTFHEAAEKVLAMTAEEVQALFKGKGLEAKPNWGALPPTPTGVDQDALAECPEYKVAKDIRKEACCHYTCDA